jgi:hypothetical protein
MREIEIIFFQTQSLSIKVASLKNILKRFAKSLWLDFNLH